jgi:predicted MPP superfamily phosphohydrolase
MNETFSIGQPERIDAKGLLLLADPHFAGVPPGQRLEGYAEQVLAKVAACLAEAKARSLAPVILGDLFHWPRENPNSLIVALIELFRPYRPWVLVGNHDKYQARYTPDVSLAVLEAAGVVRVISEPGPVFQFDARDEQGKSTRVILGASPDFTPLPKAYAKEGEELVIWITHHNIGFPDYEDKPVKVREIPGVDWIVNGHIHRPQPTQRRGQTGWVNPGGLTRMQFTRGNRERRPVALIWTPETQRANPEEGFGRFEVPFLPFEQVFPDQELPAEHPENGDSGESLFLQGLERLAWRRTQEGMGVRQFLTQNLDRGKPEAALVWELYEEVIRGEGERRS